MLSLSECNLFWSSFNIVNFVRRCMPLGKYSSKFWDKCKSVRFSRPLISSGISSSLFSETSRHTKLRRFPISAGNLWSWLWSNQSSWRDGKLPRWGGNSSISLSPKSKRSSFVSLLMDSGRCFRRFSRNSSDSSCDKLREEEKKGRKMWLKSEHHTKASNIHFQSIWTQLSLSHNGRRMKTWRTQLLRTLSTRKHSRNPRRRENFSTTTFPRTQLRLPTLPCKAFRLWLSISFEFRLLSLKWPRVIQHFRFIWCQRDNVRRRSYPFSYTTTVVAEEGLVSRKSDRRKCAWKTRIHFYSSWFPPGESSNLKEALKLKHQISSLETWASHFSISSTGVASLEL